MKTVLILVRKEDRPTFDQKNTYTVGISSISTQCKYVVEEFEKLLFWYDGANLKITATESGVDIASFDIVFLVGWFKGKMLEDIALSVSTYLVAKGVRVENTEAIYTRSRSKLSQYVHAIVSDVSVTPFLFSADGTVLARAIKTLWDKAFPVIMKDVMASRGDDNYLVSDEPSALEIAKRMDASDGPQYVLQQFIPNDGDYRIIVMGDKVTTVIHRKSQTDSHLNNTSKGGAAELLDVETLPESVVQDSIKLSRALHREIAGVDMIQHLDTGEYFLLEVNNMPQMATGSFVKEKLTQLDKYFTNL